MNCHYRIYEPSLTKFIYKTQFIPHPFLINPFMCKSISELRVCFASICFRMKPKGLLCVNLLQINDVSAVSEGGYCVLIICRMKGLSCVNPFQNEEFIMRGEQEQLESCSSRI